MVGRPIFHFLFLTFKLIFRLGLFLIKLSLAATFLFVLSRIASFVINPPSESQARAFSALIETVGLGLALIFVGLAMLLLPGIAAQSQRPDRLPSEVALWRSIKLLGGLLVLAAIFAYPRIDTMKDEFQKTGAAQLPPPTPAEFNRLYDQAKESLTRGDFVAANEYFDAAWLAFANFVSLDGNGIDVNLTPTESNRYLKQLQEIGELKATIETPARIQRLLGDGVEQLREARLLQEKDPLGGRARYQATANLLGSITPNELEAYANRLELTPSELVVNQEPLPKLLEEVVWHTLPLTCYLAAVDGGMPSLKRAVASCSGP